MNKNEKNKRAREKRKANLAAGLCAICGKMPRTENKYECVGCRAKRLANHKKHYHDKNKIAIAKTRQEYIAKGLCSACGKNEPKSINHVMCENCLEKRKQKALKYKDIVFHHYGGYKCNCCGETTKEFLTIDHVNNDGATHRKTVSCGSTYNWIIKNNFPKDLQILCANCNWGKRINGICPHKWL